MSSLGFSIDAPHSAIERLLERSWERRKRAASERELIVDVTAGALFVAAAGALLLWGGLSALSPQLAALLIAVYAVVGRVEFAVGAGYVVPTELILIPMLVMLPPAAVPVAVGLGLVIGNAFDCARGHVPPRRVLSALPDAWHAIGPALVLLAAGSPTIGFGELPLVVAAFAAGCVVDLTSSVVRTRLSGVVLEFRVQMQVIAIVWVADASLAPLGFLTAIAMRRSAFAILFVLPIVFLLAWLARERSRRIDQAQQRLKLVERERARLQSAVGRLGDAFAAKLELSGLLDILLHGSIEAVDATAGRLELAYGPSPQQLVAGAEEWLRMLECEATMGRDSAAPSQIGQAGVWTLTVPMRVAASPGVITGSLRFIRVGRAFEGVEIALVSELASKAELSAAEIIAHHAICEQAMTDSLTGLGNRRRLGEDLGRAFRDDSDGSTSLLLLFDLNGFKDYNDTFGHLAGDALLARLGTKLQRAVDGCGRAYRLGGDEFCARVELKGLAPDDVIRRASAALAETGAGFTIDASLGVVLLPHEADNAEHALQIADERMYANKPSRSIAARSQAGEVLLRTMHAKQPELDEHASNIADLARRVGRRLGLGGEALDDITRAAQLHDIGKVGVPDAILNKSGQLSESDWEFVHSHTILGERILHGAPALRGVARVVRASHERWDGSGYPDRLRGTEIPLGARIISVCDAYQAMTTDRSYRIAVAHDVACQELRRCSGSQFDPAIIGAFLAVIDGRAECCELDATQEAAVHVRTLLGLGVDEPMAQ